MECGRKSSVRASKEDDELLKSTKKKSNVNLMMMNEAFTRRVRRLKVALKR